jgi:hypothetical protein
MSQVKINRLLEGAPFVHLGLMREFEKGRKVADWMHSIHCTPSGDPFVVLSGLGAEDGARIAFAEYAKGRDGALHWRILPEIKDGTFYMRLFIEKD